MLPLWKPRVLGLFHYRRDSAQRTVKDVLNVKSLATLQEYAGQGIGPLIDSGSKETASEEAVLLITVEKIGKKLLAKVALIGRTQVQMI